MFAHLQHTAGTRRTHIFATELAYMSMTIPWTLVTIAARGSSVHLISLLAIITMLFWGLVCLVCESSFIRTWVTDRVGVMFFLVPLGCHAYILLTPLSVALFLAAAAICTTCAGKESGAGGKIGMFLLKIVTDFRSRSMPLLTAQELGLSSADVALFCLLLAANIFSVAFLAGALAVAMAVVWQPHYVVLTVAILCLSGALAASLLRRSISP